MYAGVKAKLLALTQFAHGLQVVPVEEILGPACSLVVPVQRAASETADSAPKTGCVGARVGSPAQGRWAT